MQEQEVRIEERYCGPPDSGNGGYVSGLVARFLGGSAEVTLRRPAPLGRPLLVRQLDERRVALIDGDVVVAEGLPAREDVEAPEPVGFREAAAASRRYPGFATHPFPTCFVCGPERAEGDGLRIFPGPLAGRQCVAATWTPDGTLTGADGLVRREFVWAALDCPGAFANGFPETTMVLGRLRAHLVAPVEPGTEYVIVGQAEAVEGRKHFASTALFTADGDLLAEARATWISVTPSPS